MKGETVVCGGVHKGHRGHPSVGLLTFADAAGRSPRIPRYQETAAREARFNLEFQRQKEAEAAEARRKAHEDKMAQAAAAAAELRDEQEKERRKKARLRNKRMRDAQRRRDEEVRPSGRCPDQWCG